MTAENLWVESSRPLVSRDQSNFFVQRPITTGKSVRSGPEYDRNEHLKWVSWLQTPPNRKPSPTIFRSYSVLTAIFSNKSLWTGILPETGYQTRSSFQPYSGLQPQPMPLVYLFLSLFCAVRGSVAGISCPQTQ